LAWAHSVPALKNGIALQSPAEAILTQAVYQILAGYPDFNADFRGAKIGDNLPLPKEVMDTQT